MKHLQIFLLISIAFINKIYGQDSILIQTKEISKDFSCFRNKKNQVIKSEEELKTVLYVDKYMFKRRGCDTLLPEIDFKKNNLLWVYFAGSGKGTPKVETQLYKIPAQKKYLFYIRVLCYGMQSDGILMDVHELSEKFEEGYSFEYKIEKKYLTK